MNFDIKDKVVAITGGGGVICSVLAEKMASVGAKVAVIDLFEDKAKEIADKICQSGGKAIGLGANVLEKQAVQSACDRIMEEFGRVDVLINGAGGNKPQATTSPELKFFDIPQDALEWVVNLNLMGTIIPCQIFGKIMAEQGEGVIINISSMAAYRPLTNTLAYSSAKAAISNFTQWLAVHFNHNYSEKIRVNAIAPGFLLTEQNRYLLTDKETGDMTERGKKVIDHTPMGCYGNPEQLAGPVVFLCSDAADFINGVVLPIDGGFSAFSGV